MPADFYSGVDYTANFALSHTNDPQGSDSETETTFTFTFTCGDCEEISDSDMGWADVGSMESDSEYESPAESVSITVDNDGDCVNCEFDEVEREGFYYIEATNIGLSTIGACEVNG